MAMFEDESRESLLSDLHPALIIKVLKVPTQYTISITISAIHKSLARTSLPL